MGTSLSRFYARQFGCQIVWPQDRPQGIHGIIADYCLAHNGVYLRATRPEMTVTVQVAATSLPGLGDLRPSCHWQVPRLPIALLSRVFIQAREACAHTSKESLWYGVWQPEPENEWVLGRPPQWATAGNVIIDHTALSQQWQHIASAAVVEIHSHGVAPAFFSSTDNRDEQGFRIYIVVGQVTTHPQIAVRAGLRGHYVPLAAATIGELPEGVADVGYQL